MFFYWISTILVSAMLILSAGSYLFSESAITGFRALGFPDFFRIQLVVLKFLAAFLLLIPHVPFIIKEWVYAGVALFLITAMVAHHAHKDPLWLNLINVCFFMLLIWSRYTLSKNF